MFQPSRANQSNSNWTNNNTESINNIIKLSTNWQPQSTPELVEKLYNVTKLHFIANDVHYYQTTDLLKTKDSI